MLHANGNISIKINWLVILAILQKARLSLKGDRVKLTIHQKAAVPRFQGCRYLVTEKGLKLALPR